MKFIHHDKIDFGQPTPMRLPVARAGVQPFGSHHQQAGIGERDRKGSPARAVVAGEDADRVRSEANGPAPGQLSRQCPQRRQVDRPPAVLQHPIDGLLGEPGLPAAGRHLQNAVESRMKQAGVEDLLLRRR